MKINPKHNCTELKTYMTLQYYKSTLEKNANMFILCIPS